MPPIPVVDGLLELVFPKKCLVCGTFGASYFCADCASRIERVYCPFCLKCGQPIRGEKCWNCARRSPSFTAARAVGMYTGGLRQAINDFKYNGRRMLAEPLSGLMHTYLTKSCDMPWRRVDCMVPVPIHPSRRRVRGYNQTELLTASLGEKVGLPVISDSLVRVKFTGPQVELSGDERRRNVKKSFAVVDKPAIRDKSILLIDDVATTCSTVHECSKTLLFAGARRVYVLCVAFG